MASSKDFEKIWENYQEVMKTKDVSIVDYCQRNGIVYSQFQRWYMKHVSGVSTIPNLDILLSDMERQDYIDQINDLKATNRRLLDMIDTLKQTLDTVTASNRRNEELVRKLTAQIEQLQKMVMDLQDRNNRHNKNTFGKKSLKKNKRVEEKKSREEEKEDYDGKHDNGAQVSENTDNQIDQTKVKSEYLDGERAIRPFTVSRKNSLHYSSEEGVEMAMTYLTIIETAKMWGLQVKEYLTYVWREVISGNTDYESMTPEMVIAKQNS